MTFIQCHIQLDSCSKVFYSIIYYPWLRPVPIQHTTQLPWDHTVHADIIGAKHYSNQFLSRSHFYGWVNQSPHDSIGAPEGRTHALTALSLNRSYRCCHFHTICFCNISSFTLYIFSMDTNTNLHVHTHLRVSSVFTCRSSKPNVV